MLTTCILPFLNTLRAYKVNIWSLKHEYLKYFLYLSTVNSHYLNFDYLEYPLISKRKSGPCFNTEI